MSEESPNPFQAPQVATPQRPIIQATGDKEPRSVWLVAFKWTLICGFSAAPSFFIALGTFGNESPTASITGMLAGILVFIVVYTIVETRPAVRELMSDPRKKLAARITYGIRVGISVVFPIAIWLDIITGLVSVSVSQAVIGNPEAAETPLPGFIFLWHFVTTIIQGCIMNIVVFSMLLIIYAICLAAYSVPTPDVTVDDNRVK